MTGPGSFLALFGSRRRRRLLLAEPYWFAKPGSLAATTIEFSQTARSAEAYHDQAQQHEFRREFRRSWQMSRNRRRSRCGSRCAYSWPIAPVGYCAVSSCTAPQARPRRSSSVSMAQWNTGPGKRGVDAGTIAVRHCPRLVSAPGQARVRAASGKILSPNRPY